MGSTLRCCYAVPDAAQSAGWYLIKLDDQRETGKRQTGRGSLVHGSWPTATGTV